MDSLDLADLDAFTAVARARGFRAAAALQRVSPSGLSEAVRRLETRLGVRLFNRTTRSVTLTEAGARLLQRLAPALRDVAAALDAVNAPDSAPTGTLRLNVPTIVARAVLPVIAERFLALYPGITMDIVAEDSFIDVLSAGFDAGIRYDERLDGDMIAIPIGPRRQRYACAGATSYLERNGRRNHPNDLLSHACIRHRFMNGTVLPWEFERAGQVVRITPSGPLIATMWEPQVAAAIAGLGLICSFEEAITPALASGALVPVLREWWQEFSGPYLYYPSRSLMPAPLRAFVDFVRANPAP